MTPTLDDQLRAAFASRARNTVVRADVGHPEVRHDQVPLDRLDPPRHRWSLALVAAAACVVAAGVVAAQWLDRDVDRPAVPAEALPVVPAQTDLLAISLDAAQHEVPVADISYEVLDVEAMESSGWSISEVLVTRMLSSTATPSGYRLDAMAQSPEGERFRVAIERGDVALAIPPTGTPLAIAGQPGWQVGPDTQFPMISWPRDDRLITISATRDDVPTADLLAAADVLQFAAVPELPAEELVTEPELIPSPAERADTTAATFDGWIDGAPWRSNVGTTALRSIDVNAPRSMSAISNDRSSQPTDAPATGVHMAIAGVPDHGGIAYGWTSPEAATVRVEVGAHVLTDVAMHRQAGESYFAVPIPTGVAVDRLVFIGEAGDEVASCAVPPIPEGLDGNFVRAC